MKNKRRLTGYLSLIAVVFSLWVFSGCSKSSDAGPTMNIALLMTSTTYLQSATVTDDKALDSLIKYLTVYPDLVALLGGTDKYTFFAPSNKAFKNLLATPYFPSDIKLINPDLIKGVLSYHLVAGQQLQASLTSGSSFNTLYADPSTSTVQTIIVNTDGTLKTGSSNQSIHITVADQKATNGVMHITESVLIPPSVGSVLTPILGTIAGTVLLGADFSDLAQIVTKADAGFTEDPSTLKFKIATWLAMPVTTASKPTVNATGFTFFAIPNAVFKAAAAGQSITEAQLIAALSSTSDAARGLLANHFVSGGKYVVTASAGATTFAQGQSITTKGKAITNVTVTTPSAQTGPYGVVLTNAATPTASSSAYVAVKDVVQTNGVIQVIAGILK